MEVYLWREISRRLKKIRFEFENIKRDNSKETLEKRQGKLDALFNELIDSIEKLESLKSSEDTPANPEQLRELQIEFESLRNEYIKEIESLSKKEDEYYREQRIEMLGLN